MRSDEKPQLIEFYKFKIVWIVMILSISTIVLHFHPIKLPKFDFSFDFPDPPRFTPPASQAGSGAAEAEMRSSRRNFPGFDDYPADAELERVRRLPKSGLSPFYFESGQQIFVGDLVSETWSRQIVIQQEAKHFRISAGPDVDHYFIWFKDDHIQRVDEKDVEVADFGVRRGIFRILVEKPGQKVTVTVSDSSEISELERVKRLPKSSERPFSFEPQRKVFETDLEAGVWSREIVLPPNTKLHYRVDVTPGGGRFFIWYKDGFVGEVTNEKEIEKFGVRYGIFRVLAEQPGRKVTVTITN